jgi:nucleotide-binding universal stress UspA family protein
MYSDLIIGFDGSPEARDALAFARRLALATGARPTVLYVRSHKLPGAEGARDADDGAWGAGADVELDVAKELMTGVPGVTFEGVSDTSPARALHRAAEEADAAMIVLGATHRTEEGRLRGGTMAEAVIHAAPCAVAMVPAGYAEAAESRPLGLVTAAVDGGDETERVARVAGRIARRAGGSLRLVSVSDVPFTHGPAFAGSMGYSSMKEVVKETVRETLERAAEAAGPGVELDIRVGEGDVAEAVALHSEGADLLVIGSRGYGPLRRVVLGTASGKILRAATCPVLVVPRRTAEELDDAIVPLGAATLQSGADAGAAGKADGEG